VHAPHRDADLNKQKYFMSHDILTLTFVLDLYALNHYQVPPRND